MPKDKLYPGQIIDEELLNLMFIRDSFGQILAPGLRSIFSTFYKQGFFQQYAEENEKWSPEEMAKQVELYRNVIETKYGVKLCVKRNINSDITSMELLVPNKLFANDDGRESLADALQNIAMFVLNMENPDGD